MSNSLKVLRVLISELRHASSNQKISELLHTRYILQQYRKYSLTDQQLCKAQEEMKYLAETYLCYLQSQRRYHGIYSQYYSKGERSVRDTANMLGFKMPQDPK